MMRGIRCRYQHPANCDGGLRSYPKQNQVESFTGYRKMLNGFATLHANDQVRQHDFIS